MYNVPLIYCIILDSTYTLVCAINQHRRSFDPFVTCFALTRTGLRVPYSNKPVWDSLI